MLGSRTPSWFLIAIAVAAILPCPGVAAGQTATPAPEPAGVNAVSEDPLAKAQAAYDRQSYAEAMTLFRAAAPTVHEFQEVLSRFFGGTGDAATEALLSYG